MAPEEPAEVYVAPEPEPALAAAAVPAGAREVHLSINGKSYTAVVEEL